mmetsp:Transcript_18371/g.38601  ORF Transcript_18371/g.38601 Transcript_18371/m.38601 type:complete len:249 (+) Transcript_18371:295-1041(+)
MTASHASVRRTVLTTTALFLFFLSSPTPASAATIFEAKFPTACVNPLLSLAGFCALNNGCTKTCFKSSKTFGSASGSTTSTVSDTTPASPLALFAQALDNFYVPVDAVDCNEFEDPICPATTCCPACRDQLADLFRCLILESDLDFLDYLARNCPIDCAEGNSGGGFALLERFGGGTSILEVEDMPMPGMGMNTNTNTNMSIPDMGMNETNATVPMMGDDDVFLPNTEREQESSIASGLLEAIANDAP